MGYYQGATICINGHVLSSTTSDYVKFCKSCGKNTISTCEHCNAKIEGEYYTEDLAILDFFYQKPSYCNHCGNAYPWTRLLLDNAVELISLDEELPPNQKEIIKNAFPNLIVETPITPVAIAKYKKYIAHSAPYVQEGIRNLLINIVSDSVKRSIWG